MKRVSKRQFPLSTSISHLNCNIELEVRSHKLFQERIDSKIYLNSTGEDATC